MNHSLIIKSITLLGFIFLLSMFLLYRSGKFESPFPSENHLAENDTIPRKKDTSRKTFASSSKTLILVDDYKNKTFLETERQIDSIEKQKKRRILFSGSKSGPVFTPGQVQIKPDLSQLGSQSDTLDPNVETVLGYSTKSASVFSKKDLNKVLKEAERKHREDSIKACKQFIADSIAKIKSE